jgi:hypothetical protein
VPALKLLGSLQSGAGHLPPSLWLAISIFLIDNMCVVVAPIAAWQQTAGWQAEVNSLRVALHGHDGLLIIP